MRAHRLGAAAILAAGLLCVGLASGASAADQEDSWPFSGGDIQNTRSASEDGRLEPKNVGTLVKKWAFTTAGDVSATPTVEGGALYSVDWAGYVYRIDTETGTAVWRHKKADYTGNAASVSRTSPAIGSHSIVFGDQAAGKLIAVDKHDGHLLWTKLLDPLGAITSSPVISGNVVYVGVASLQEFAAVEGLVPTFRGSVAAVDLNTGALIWQTYTAPKAPPGYEGVWYTGASIWGSNPVVDLARKAIYVGTGNNYSVPPVAATCLGYTTTAKEQLACLAPDDYVDSVLALDMTTGSIKWARRLQGADTWQVNCLYNSPTGIPCPKPAGPDYDFSSAPNLFTVDSSDHDGWDRDSHWNHEGRSTFLGAGEKSGIYWALNPDNGEVRWSTQVGPGGSLGGIEWGSATDGRNVYVAITNHTNTTITLPDGSKTTGGTWSALDGATGKILWQIPVKGTNPVSGLPAEGLGSVTVVHGVMFAPSMSGDMVAIDARSGKILWDFASGGSIIDGPSVVDDTIYFGSGYGRFTLGKANNKIFAFTLR